MKEKTTVVGSIHIIDNDATAISLSLFMQFPGWRHGVCAQQNLHDKNGIFFGDVVGIYFLTHTENACMSPSPFSAIRLPLLVQRSDV